MRGMSARGVLGSIAAVGLLVGACSDDDGERAAPEERSTTTSGVEATTTTTEPVVDSRSYLTRPDITPLVIDVKADRTTAPGFWFLAPKNASAQTGPLIVDDAGEVVWSKPLPERDSAADFRVQTYEGEPVLTWWEGVSHRGWGEGEFVIADTSYEEIARLKAGNGRQGDLHELQLTDDGTALVLVYAKEPADLSAVGGPEDGFQFDNYVQEIDVATGEVLFEWSAAEHVPMSDSYEELEESGTEEDPYDWFHVNSADLTDDGDVIISARNTHAIYTIDRDSGEIRWRLGGKSSDFEMGERATFGWQHDARQQPDGTISLFDNRANSDAEPASRALVLRLDEEAMTASVVRELGHPDGVRSRTQGNTVLLPDGGMLIGWGNQGRVSEHAPDGTVVFDMSWFPADSYRVYRFDWHGTPTQRPDVAAEAADGDKVDVHVSWNGATDVARWRVLGGAAPDALEPLATADKTGFETTITVDAVEHLTVEALDAAGAVLASSEIVSTG